MRIIKYILLAFLVIIVFLFLLSICSTKMAWNANVEMLYKVDTPKLGARPDLPPEGMPSAPITTEEPIKLLPPVPVSEAPKTASIVDSYIEKMKEGKIIFNVPGKIKYMESKNIQLVLSPHKEIKEMMKEFKKTEDKIAGHTIKISNLMRATLTGENFEILPISPEEQAVSFEEDSIWIWKIKALKSGPQNLSLVINAVIKVDDITAPRLIKTFEEVIKVNYPLYLRIKNFIKENWEWLWTTLIIPGICYLWHNRRKKRKKRVHNTV